MATIAAAIADATAILRAAAISEPRRDAGYLLANLLARDIGFVITHPEYELTAIRLLEFQKRIARRARGEPLQYITGVQEFYGLTFEVSSDVLIPRPETELLVEPALEVLAGTERKFILDVGTGSGCISIALLNHRPQAFAYALDLSLASLRLARRNAQRHGVHDRIRFFAADALTALRTAPLYDVVVSNPPYVADKDWTSLPAEVREYEPRRALTSGPEGLSMIRRLIAETASVLVPGGHFLFEIGSGQAPAVHKMVSLEVWRSTSIRLDLQQIPRVFILQKR